MNIIKSAGLGLLLALSSTAALATTSLIGSEQSWQYFAYGGAYNSATNYTVGAGTEGTFMWYFDIDVDATSITFDYLSSATWSDSSLSLFPTIHNGIAINQLSGPAFSSISINSATNLAGFDNSRFSFTNNQLQIDWTGLTFNPDTVVKFDVNVAAVPEPETYALMFAGLGLVGFAARRKAGKARK